MMKLIFLDMKYYCKCLRRPKKSHYYESNFTVTYCKDLNVTLHETLAYVLKDKLCPCLICLKWVFKDYSRDEPITHFYNLFLHLCSIPCFYTLFLYLISIPHFYTSILYLISIPQFYTSFLYLISMPYFYTSFIYLISMPYFYTS